MKLSIVAGATSQTVNVFVRDSSSTTGAGLTGLVYNTSSLVAYYALPKAAAVSITLATLVAVTSSYSSGGFKEIDATNMPGWYRFDIPNAALASGIFVSIHLKGATNMAPLPLEIALVVVDPQTAASDSSGVTTLLSRVGGSISLSAGAVTVGTNNDKTGYALSSGGVQAVWDALTSALTTTGSIGKLLANYATGLLDTAVSGHTTSGTVGQLLNSAGGSGDPWSTAVPGAYSAGTAGYILGTNLNATVSSRLASASISLSGGAVTVGTLNSGPIQAVWDAATSALTTSGSIGKHIVDFLDVAISSRSTYDGLDTTGVTTLLTRLPSAITLTAGKVNVNDKTGFSLSAAGVQSIWDSLTSADITSGSIGKLIVDNLNAAISTVSTVASIFGATASSYNVSGTMGQKINSAASAGDPWSTSIPGAYSSGQAGYILGTNLNATVSSRSTYSGGAVASVTGSVGSVTSGVTVTTNNDKTGYALSSGGIQAVWDALTSALTTTGSIGKLLVTDINATISSRSTYAGGDTSGVTTLLTRLPSAITLTAGAVNVNDKTGFSLSVGGIAAIWNALTSGMSTSGSIGKLLKDDIDAKISTRTVPADLTSLTVTTVSDKTGYSLSSGAYQAIWDVLTSALSTSGSIGKLLVDKIDATISSRLATSAITLSTGAVTVGTNNDKTGYALSSAGVDSILDDTPTAELSAIPSFTASLRTMIQYVFQYHKGKRTVTTSTETMLKADGSTSLGTASISDDGTTFTKGNMS